MNGQCKHPVGHCSPPGHSRFKPGKSGNPKGRPKKSDDLFSGLNQALNRKVTENRTYGIAAMRMISGRVLHQRNGERLVLQGDRSAALNGSSWFLRTEQITEVDRRQMA